MPRIVVDVMLKPEILDPQGRAVQGALGRLGLAGVLSVRQGKRFEIEIEGDLDEQREAQLEELAGSLLSNPVIEDWNLYLADEAGGHAEPAESQEQPIDEPDLTPAQDQVAAVDAAGSVAAPVPDAQPAPGVSIDAEVKSESAPIPDGASALEVTPAVIQNDASWDDAQLRAGGEGQ